MGSSFNICSHVPHVACIQARPFNISVLLSLRLLHSPQSPLKRIHHHVPHGSVITKSLHLTLLPTHTHTPGGPVMSLIIVPGVFPHFFNEKEKSHPPRRHHLRTYLQVRGRCTWPFFSPHTTLFNESFTARVVLLCSGREMSRRGWWRSWAV